MVHLVLAALASSCAEEMVFSSCPSTFLTVISALLSDSGQILACWTRLLAYAPSELAVYLLVWSCALFWWDCVTKRVKVCFAEMRTLFDWARETHARSAIAAMQIGSQFSWPIGPRFTSYLQSFILRNFCFNCVEKAPSWLLLIFETEWSC